MFVEKRKRGKSARYYLVHAFRDKGEVRKIRRFLGTNLGKAELAAKKGIAEGIIREQARIYKSISDPLKTSLSERELEELRSLEAKGEAIVSHLSESDWGRFTEQFAYDTNAIEGASVTKGEVKGILAEGKWPAERAKWEISETYGVSEAIRLVRETKTHVSVELVRQLHHVVFRNSKPFAGEFRKPGQEVAVVDQQGNVIHRGAPSSKVRELLEELVGWYNKNRKRYPPITIACVVHNQFENIHPFLDGNGRVGRLLLVNILLKHGLPPVNIRLANRQKYYSALQEYQKGNIRPSIELVLEEYKGLKANLKA